MTANIRIRADITIELTGATIESSKVEDAVTKALCDAKEFLDGIGLSASYLRFLGQKPHSLELAEAYIRECGAWNSYEEALHANGKSDSIKLKS
ncbi:MAG: hypothetical protein U0930_15105 [Pirellulales bacterium]